MSQTETTTLGCGCKLSTIMFFPSHMTGLHICHWHLHVPEVQEAKVKDVWGVILAHNVLTAEDAVFGEDTMAT